MLHLLNAARAVVDAAKNKMNPEQAGALVKELREQCTIQMEEHEHIPFKRAAQGLTTVGLYDRDGTGTKAVVTTEDDGGVPANTVIGFIMAAHKVDPARPGLAPLKYYAWMGWCFCGEYDNEKDALVNVSVAHSG